MWTRNNNVSNWNMLKHFIYLNSDKLITSLLCSLYYRYSLKSSSFFYILSFLVKAISIDQTFYSATHYLVAVWLDSRHNLNSIWVEVKLFCFMIVLLLVSRTIDFKLRVKFENRRKLICISITRLILFIHVFSRIIWCWFNWVINIEAVSIIWSWTVRFK